MTVNWELFTVIGVIIAVLTFWMTFFRKPSIKEEMEALTVSFKANQTLSQQITEDLFKLATEANGWQSEFSPGVTYRVAYEMIVANHEKTLSDRLLENVKAENPTKSIIASMQKSLESQFTELQKLQMGILTVRKTWELSDKTNNMVP